MSDLSTDPQGFALLWAATYEGRRVRLCAVHVVSESVSNIAPASSGRCVICGEAVSPSNHAISRWLERVKPGTVEEAASAILEFVADAVTAGSPPRWLRAKLEDGIEVLVNDRRPNVLLLKKRHRRGRQPVIVTVITTESYAETGRLQYLAGGWQ